MEESFGTLLDNESQLGSSQLGSEKLGIEGILMEEHPTSNKADRSSTTADRIIVLSSTV